MNKIDSSKGAKHACVKSSGIINAPAEKVFKLFADNSRVKGYNFIWIIIVVVIIIIIIVILVVIIIKYMSIIAIIVLRIIFFTDE